jgi:uncharacterized protein
MNVSLEKIKQLAIKYDLSLVILFGSQATEETHKGSDVDIAYISDRALSLTEEGALIVDLMPVVRSHDVDLANIRNASPLLLYEIVRSGIVLYEKTPSSFLSLYTYAFRVYEETRPLFELRSEYLKNRAAHMRVL